MKVHFIQHGLSDLHSHYYQETIAWKTAIDFAGFGWYGYSNKGLPANLARVLGATPAFPYAPDASVDLDPVSREISDLLFLSETFSNACKALNANGVAPEDLVILPYSTQRELYAMARWLQTMPPAERPRVAFVFHIPDFLWTLKPDRNSISGNFTSWRFAANQLRRVLPLERLFIGALDSRLAQFLGTAFDLPVHPVPIVNLFIERALQYRTAKKPFDVTVAGELRIEKGSTLTLPLVIELLRRRPTLKVALQVPNRRVEKAVRAAFTAAGCLESVDLAVGQLSQFDYTVRLAQSGLIVLPYDPARYAIRNSGICSESFGYGVPVVVPANTWMSDRLDDASGSGIAFADWTATSICDSVEAALANLPELTKLAGERAAPWRENHGATSILNQIMATLA